jgi:threonine aldolase
VSGTGGSAQSIEPVHSGHCCNTRVVLHSSRFSILALARQANLMADRLSAKLAAVGLAPVWPVKANLVFVVLPRALDARRKAAGARYNVRTNAGR